MVLDAKTKMNPNLNYGQTIPGRRWSGARNSMIDTYYTASVEMLDALHPAGYVWKAMTPAIKKEQKEWFYAVCRVTCTDKPPVAAEESQETIIIRRRATDKAYVPCISATKNWHQILKEFPAASTFQTEPDGKQPLELERTTVSVIPSILTHMPDMSFITTKV